MKKNFLFCGSFLCAAIITARAQSGTDGNISWKIVHDTLIISGNGAMSDYNSVLEQPWYSYQKNYRVSTVVIENGVTTVGSCAFLGNRLTSVIIGNSVTSVGLGAFARSGLQSVIIPNSVKFFNRIAFLECLGLKSIIIPDSVISIGVGAFLHCYNLTSITIPNSVDSIGIGAFSGCNNLTEIINYAEKPQSLIEEVKFFRTKVNAGLADNATQAKCTLRVPAASITAYRAANGWKDFTNIEAIQ